MRDRAQPGRAADAAPSRRFEPLAHPIVFEVPRHLSDVDSWHEHIPFAFFAVAALRPRVFVELGTWKGDSYCAFCQAVQTLGLATHCYAVDTWRGDDHTGPYGPEVLEALRVYHDPLYGGAFSRLLQLTFDDAAPRFARGSIDLLHIDGCHTYEAVAHDVETWLPNLSDRAVLLLHDTNVREGEFGVWRLWDELSARYPGFAFAHGHGLGVLAVGGRVDPRFLAFLDSSCRDPLASRFFSTLGSRVAAPARERRARAAIELTAAQTIGSLDAARAALEQEAERAREGLDHARAELARLETELGARSCELAGERDEVRRLQSEVLAREADIANIVRSISWRLTAPLRGTKRHVHGLGDVERVAPRVRRAVAVRLRRGRFVGAELDPRGPLGPASASRSARLGVDELHLRPLVSIVTPVFNTDPEWLRRAVDSVRRQTYPNWQLCLADDGSTDDRTLQYLRSIAADPAIEVTYGVENRGIAEATNRALASAEGDFVAFLDHDDELEPDALLECVRRLNDRPDTDVVYTDEDKISRRGRLSDPFFKPDWSPEFFRGVMYVGHLLMVRRTVVESVGRLDSTFDGVQDYELMLRVAECTQRIEHVPRVLYHWRTLPESVASSMNAKKGISELQALATGRHLERSGIAAVARPNPAFPHRAMLLPAPRERWPRVTLIVPTKDAPEKLGRCLGSIFARSTYPNFVVLLVDNGTTDAEALSLFSRHPVDVLDLSEPFNFSRANNLAVERADGEFVVFLNNDTEVVTPEWLEVLVDLGERDGVGAVGPLLVYPGGAVQHAGVVLGLRGTADHIMRNFPSTGDGYAGSLSCTREVSAVTGACMAVRRELFAEVGAFDEHFATHYQDVDLCLRLRRSGRRNLYTPRAVLRHDEGGTRGSRYDHLDRALLLDSWGETIACGDPYYNPSLSLGGDDYRPRVAAAS